MFIKRRRGTRPRVPAIGINEKENPMRRGRCTNSTVGDDAYIVPQQANTKKKIQCGMVKCCVSTSDFILFRVHSVVTPGGVTLRMIGEVLLIFPQKRAAHQDRSG